MIRFKPEVRIAYFHPLLGAVLEYATVWSLRAGVDVEINSINDGGHTPKSLHGFDLALDLDTVGDKSAHLVQLYAWLARYLPPHYDVVHEHDHVHVEIDYRRGAPFALPGRGTNV